MKKRVLFVLKFRDVYSYGCDTLSSGLFNSARFVVQMLVAAGIEAKLVQVIDNNDIDREVTQYRPTHVVIEGLWVVPEKFDVLRPLHPSVTWIVRIHSEIPFLATEGIAMDWIIGYVERGTRVAMNSHRGYRDILDYVEAAMGSSRGVLLLPNYYPKRDPSWQPHGKQDFVKIGCFGAIRPLKNQLIQALAAIGFAESLGKELVFYMNGRDCEGGENVSKNLRALFENTGHRLVTLDWLPHEQFLDLLQQLDAGMAVSFSESFCICAADLVANGVPVVVSPEVQWASGLSYVNPTDARSIKGGLFRVTGVESRAIRWLNRAGLERYSARSRQTWLDYLGEKAA